VVTIRPATVQIVRMLFFRSKQKQGRASLSICFFS